MPAVRKSDSMPNVRASSGTMGTTSLPISTSLSILRSMPTNAIVVETSLPSLPSWNSLKSSSWSAARGDRKSTRLNSSHDQDLVCRLLLEKKKKKVKNKKKKTKKNKKKRKDNNITYN